MPDASKNGTVRQLPESIQRSEPTSTPLESASDPQQQQVVRSGHYISSTLGTDQASLPSEELKAIRKVVSE